MHLVHQDGMFRYTSNDGAWNINFWRLHSTYDWALHRYLITILLEGCFDIPFWCWAFRPNVSRLLLQHGHAATSCLALWHSPKQRGFGRAMKGDTENCRAGKGMTEAFSFWPSHGHHGHLSKKVVGTMGSTYNVKVARLHMVRQTNVVVGFPLQQNRPLKCLLPSFETHPPWRSRRWLDKGKSKVSMSCNLGVRYHLVKP